MLGRNNGILFWELRLILQSFKKKKLLKTQSATIELLTPDINI